MVLIVPLPVRLLGQDRWRQRGLVEVVAYGEETVGWRGCAPPLPGTKPFQQPAAQKPEHSGPENIQRQQGQFMSPALWFDQRDQKKENAGHKADDGGRQQHQADFF